MRVMPREQSSRSELIQRCRQVAISVSLALSIAACGGGGGGGGGSAPVQNNPPPPAQNAAPTVQAGADQTITLPTASAQLNGSATDDSSTSLTYAWTATSGPSGVTFGTANAAATTVTFPAAGTYVLTLSVSDGSATGTDTVTVTVNPAAAEPAVYPASDTANSDPTNHGWTKVAAADVGMNQALLDQAATYAQTSGAVLPSSAGIIVRGGKLVHSWGNIDQRFDVKSTTKSIGGMALGLAYDNHTLALTDLVSTKLPDFGVNPPENVGKGWLPSITVQQLATHTAGFLKNQNYPVLQYQPGTTFFYSDGGLNWLADTLTAVLNQDLATVLNTSVWTPLGVNSTAGGDGSVNVPTNSDVHWRDNASGRTNPANRELNSGIYANANAMARVGLLYLRNGMWGDQRILSEDFVSKAHTPVPENASLNVPEAADFPGAPANYGMLWWTNATGQLPNVPRDAYWAWGLGDSLIVVIPSLDIVVVRAGRPVPGTTDPDPGARVWNDYDWNGDYSVLAPFLDPIVQSVSQ
jgi:CubicO group peptidase (beta-lactamase class C family)